MIRPSAKRHSAEGCAALVQQHLSGAGLGRRRDDYVPVGRRRGYVPVGRRRGYVPVGRPFSGQTPRRRSSCWIAPGQRWLGHAGAPGGAAEVQFPGDSYESSHQLQIQRLICVYAALLLTGSVRAYPPAPNGSSYLPGHSFRPPHHSANSHGRAPLYTQSCLHVLESCYETAASSFSRRINGALTALPGGLFISLASFWRRRAIPLPQRAYFRICLAGSGTGRLPR